MWKPCHLALAAAIPLLAGCAVQPAASAREFRVERGAFRSHMVLTGEIHESRTHDLSVPKLPNWQTTIRWMAADGSRVAKGDRVVEFDNSEFARQIEELKLRESRAGTELERIRADLEGREAEKAAEVQRRRIAWEKARRDADLPESLLPLRDWQEKQLALERASIALEKAENDWKAQQSAAGAEIGLKTLDLDKARRDKKSTDEAVEALVLHAPEDGIVLTSNHPWEGRKLQIGDGAWIGMSVASMPDLTALEVVAWLPDVDDGRIRGGERGRAWLDAWPALEFPGKVLEVAAAAREPQRMSQRRAFRVRFALDRVDSERMRPGMSVRVELDTSQLDSALLAPRGGLDLSGELPRARLRGGDLREVKLGDCNGESCVVEAGLDEGTILVAGGTT